MTKFNKKLITSIFAVLAVIITIVGITYAYFITRLNGNTAEKSAEVSAGELKIEYDDGNGLLESDKIIPGLVIASKTFTVTNTGTHYISSYEVVLENIINELEYDATNDLVYSIVCTSSKDNNCNGGSGIFPTETTTLVTNAIDEEEEQTYNLVLTYKETNTNQSDSMDKKISAKINIESDYTGQ